MLKAPICIGSLVFPDDTSPRNRLVLVEHVCLRIIFSEPKDYASYLEAIQAVLSCANTKATGTNKIVSEENHILSPHTPKRQSTSRRHSLRHYSWLPFLWCIACNIFADNGTDYFCNHFPVLDFGFPEERLSHFTMLAHAEQVDRVWSANEHSLGILRHCRELSLGYKEYRPWDTFTFSTELSPLTILKPNTSQPTVKNQYFALEISKQL